MAKASTKSVSRKSTRRKRAVAKPLVPAATQQEVTTVSTVPVQAATVTTQSTVWQLLQRTLGQARTNWVFWLKFVGLFALLNIILVHNLGNDVSSLKSQLASFLGDNSAATGVGTYALVLKTGSAAGGSAGVYQYILLILSSLAAIWALRQFMSDQPPATLRLRDSLYRGMTPIIPFVLVLIVLSLELIPLILAGGLYGIVATGGIIRTWFEQLIFLAIFFAGLGFTLWLIMRSIFALYIVTLVDMTPIRALRDAAQIVKGQQLNLIRKIVFLLAFLLIGSMIVLLPVIFVAPALTRWVFFILTMAALPFVHSYLYSLYRELLG